MRHSAHHTRVRDARDPLGMSDMSGMNKASGNSAQNPKKPSPWDTSSAGWTLPRGPITYTLLASLVLHAMLLLLELDTAGL